MRLSPTGHPRTSPRTTILACLLVLAALILVQPTESGAKSVPGYGSGFAVNGTSGDISFRLKGGINIREIRATGNRPGGRLGFLSGGKWFHATRLISRKPFFRQFVLKTNDPAGRRIQVRVGAMGRKGWKLDARVLGKGPQPVDSIGMGFRLGKGERLLGFGERSDHVNQRGNEVENYVGEGPYQETDYPIVRISVPSWGIRQRSDATYYPIPWMLSTRGYGVLSGNAETSRFRLGSEKKGEWSFEADSSQLNLKFFSGPKPADVLRRMTARTGRQPKPKAPWVFGPWFQTGHQNTAPGELGYIQTLRDADAPISAVETHMRYMPCGSDLGQEATEKDRVAGLQAGGLAAITYTREGICASYSGPYDEAFAKGAFIRRQDGTPYTFNTFVGSGVTQLGMLDFTHPDAQGVFAGILDRAYEAGYDGWMEDYGEYAPPDSVSYNGIQGKRLHNLHPVFYHRGGLRYADSKERPIVSFVRSGFTGSARYSQIVWGGDPTTGWGFDGLESSVTQALTMGLSGVSTWGSDIGGFFSFSPQKLDPELLSRWVGFGAFSGVMRSKGEGIGATMESRPQVWEEPVLPIWRRYAKLRTQMYPYLAGADATYRRTGMPVMRHLSLTNPRDRRAGGIEDQFMFGPGLLVSPVVTPGATDRKLYLPKGRWVNFWRAIGYDESDGSFSLGQAKLQRGGRDVKVAAPLEQVPLMARAGALLPLLPADTDTLAPYAKSVYTGLDDNRRKLHLIAFPRGRSTVGFYEKGQAISKEGRREWSLTLRGAGKHELDLEASMKTLKRPFVPAVVKAGKRRLAKGDAWSFDRKTGVLQVKVTLKAGQTLRVSAKR
ncbi:MAG: hypothetical protein M3Y45_09040 [Actinomycetota bacterium]|nr:hypothetical protein [Actinomycetota bacterium]